MSSEQSKLRGGLQKPALWKAGLKETHIGIPKRTLQLPSKGLCLLLLSQSLKIALDVRRLSRKIAPPSWVRSIRFSVDYTDVHVILPR